MPAAHTQCPCPTTVEWATTAPIGTRPCLEATCSPLPSYVLPLYPPAASSGLYATPKVANLTSIISSEEEEEYYEIRYVTPLCAMWENLHFVCISCVSGRLILVCPL